MRSAADFDIRVHVLYKCSCINHCITCTYSYCIRYTYSYIRCHL